MLLLNYRGDDMSRRGNQNNQYNGNYNGNQYYGNQYYNQNGQQYYNQNGQQYYSQNGQPYYNQNGQQYYNQNPSKPPKNNRFGFLSQQEQNNKQPNQDKKSLFIKIGLFSAFAIILIIIVLCINSCGKKEVEPEYEDSKVVGKENIGYVTIPSDWVIFKNQNPVRGIQYSDINGEYIITLESLSTSQINARDYALGTASNLEKAGITLQGSEVKLGKYNAYQIYGQSQNNIWVLVYFFEAEDGYTHYVGIEGPDRNNEAFKIPETFKTTKES